MMFVIKHLWANYSSPFTFRSKYNFYKFHWRIPGQYEGFSCRHPYNLAEVNKLCKKFKEGHQSYVVTRYLSRLNLYVWWILWTNDLAAIFSKFNIPCKHAFRVMVVTVSGEKLSTQTPDPSDIFVQKVMGRSPGNISRVTS